MGTALRRGAAQATAPLEGRQETPSVIRLTKKDALGQRQVRPDQDVVVQRASFLDLGASEELELRIRLPQSRPKMVPVG